jgi:hypothetical protein
MTDETGKKKIIIDEDWKSQIEAEREEQQPGQQQQQGQQPDSGSAANDGRTMPPASFEMLLTTFATEAMISLGLIPHPLSGKQEVARDQAKYFIDTLEMLKQKTAGNLTPDEDKALEGLVHQLRMAFVSGELPGSDESPIISPTGGPPPT